MKNAFPIFVAYVLLGLIIFNTNSLSAQAIAPEKSAKAAAISDMHLIEKNIKDDQDIMFLSQKALERSKDERIKEVAQEMLTDFTAMLYPMEQLASAGTGSSNQNEEKAEGVHQQAAEVNAKLAGSSGEDFDTIWVFSLLNMQQAKYDELTLAKETVRNPQLKMAITDAIPVIRKHLSQMRSIQKSLIKMALQKKKEAAKKQKSK
jgi:predicted outer membrane protein